jgi:putative phage-type endonuclease
MNIVNLIQGSPEWHAHRADHFNASDAPAMMGVSPYRTRADLLRERASGIADDVSADTQRLFDRGHRAEALARPLAEQIIGEELFPATVTECRLSASLDGMTMDGSTIFEHKLLSKRLREAFAAIEEVCGDGSMLPEDYRVQMEQQLAVSGAERCLFMASEWDGDGNLIIEYHCWYEPDLALRARIVAGWEQFERDLDEYVPAPAEAPKPAGKSPETLPSLNVQATGTVLASNLDQFREHAMAVLSGINRDLQTDDDFADAEKTVKWCGDVEQRLAAAKANVLGQMESVDAVCRTIDEISAETRRIRLELDKLVKSEKESRKAEIVRAGVDAVREHYAQANVTLGEYAIAVPASLQSAIGAVIKGLRSLQSIRDAVGAAVANTKIAATQQVERVRQNIAVFDQFKGRYMRLFPDRVALVQTKETEDFRNLVTTRIAEDERKEAERIEAERERIRAEERAEAAAAVGVVAAPGQYPSEADKTLDLIMGVDQTDPVTGKRIKLGDINAAIAPLSVTADGLASLGFQPVGHERAAKLYAEADFPRMIAAMVKRLSAAPLAKAA